MIKANPGMPINVYNAIISYNGLGYISDKNTAIDAIHTAILLGPVAKRNTDISLACSGNLAGLDTIIIPLLPAIAPPPPPPPPPPSSKAKLDAWLPTIAFDDDLVKFKRVDTTTITGQTYTLDHSDGRIYLLPKTLVNIVPIMQGQYQANYKVLSLPYTYYNQPNLTDLIFMERNRGIYTIKAINSSCYYEYAKLRLNDPQYFDKLWAMERPVKPRPLAFKTDKDWQDFINETKTIFASYYGPDAYMSIIGTSTELFSRNPNKGENQVFFESWPQCQVTANNPAKTNLAYGFDSEGKDKSDIDINLFIPKLSDDCMKNAAVTGGNAPNRYVFYQNSPKQNIFRYCLTNPVNTAFLNHVSKWEKMLNNREINWSAHMRPDQRNGKYQLPGIVDFNRDLYVTKSRFIIPINDGKLSGSAQAQANALASLQRYLPRLPQDERINLLPQKHSFIVGGHNYAFEIANNGKFLWNNGGIKHEVDVAFDDVSNDFKLSCKNPGCGLPIPALDIKNDANIYAMVQLQRLHGINYLKKAGKGVCYLAYAHKRFNNHVTTQEKLWAIERPVNPRPLVFDNDQDWAMFQDELRALFIDLHDVGAYVTLLGTSTTFFSENPSKGENKFFFENAPQCQTTANGPSTASVASFDVAGVNSSAVDIELFIPKLSDICAQAFSTHPQKGGNDGNSATYYENTLAECFKHASAPPNLRNMYDPLKPTGIGSPGGNRSPWQAGSAFANFMDKWKTKMGRELNFSVHIRPDQKTGAPLTAKKDFSDDVDLKYSRFKIPLID